MELNDVQLAGLKLALATLESKPDYEHPLSVIRRLAGPEVVAQIKEVAAEYRAANQAAYSQGVALLSASAADYWQEARGVLAYGRLVMSMGSRAAEKALSRKCEALDESFEARVASSERGMFLIHELDGGNWDDRWHSCVDFNFPLLRMDLAGGIAYPHPLSEAQRTVLGSLVRPIVEPEVRLASVERWSGTLRALARGESLTLANHQKRKAKQAAAEQRAAKIAAGDQQLTKDQRGAALKLVDGLFDTEGGA